VWISTDAELRRAPTPLDERLVGAKPSHNVVGHAFQRVDLNTERNGWVWMVVVLHFRLSLSDDLKEAVAFGYLSTEARVFDR